MKSKTTKILQIITSVIAALYFIGTAMSFFCEDGLSSLKPSDYLYLVPLLIFMVGFAFSWRRQKIAGIILMVWNASIWIYDLYLFRVQDWGMASSMAVPVMVIGALFLLQWYKTTKLTASSKKQQWKFILRVLLINYAVLYAIVVFSSLSVGESVDYFSLPFILFPLLLLVFIGGFAVSWKSEFYAGFILLFWYVILLFGTIAYSEFFSSGPWIMFGIPILLQGIFYLNQHYRYRPK